MSEYQPKGLKKIIDTYEEKESNQEKIDQFEGLKRIIPSNLEAIAVNEDIPVMKIEGHTIFYRENDNNSSFYSVLENKEDSLTHRLVPKESFGKYKRKFRKEVMNDEKRAVQTIGYFIAGIAAAGFIGYQVDPSISGVGSGVFVGMLGGLVTTLWDLGSSHNFIENKVPASHYGSQALKKFFGTESKEIK